MTHNESIVQCLQALARKAVCQAQHVQWMQSKTGCTEEETEAELLKRLNHDVIPFRQSVLKEAVQSDVARVMKKKP